MNDEEMHTQDESVRNMLECGVMDKLSITCIHRLERPRCVEGQCIFTNQAILLKAKSIETLLPQMFKG